MLNYLIPLILEVILSQLKGGAAATAQALESGQTVTAYKLNLGPEGTAVFSVQIVPPTA